MEAFGVAPKIRNEVVECADNAHIASLKDRIYEIDRHQYNELIEEMKKFPAKFRKPPTHPTWRPPYSVKMFIDAPMHHLDLGSTRGTHTFNMTMLARLNRKAPIKRAVSHLLSPFEDMKLEFLKVQHSFSSMVSDEMVHVSYLLS